MPAKNKLKAVKAAEPVTVEVAAPVVEPVIVAIKGFDADFKCRGYQYEVGKTYEHDGKVKACSSGFHSVENPMDVFGYYGPGTSVYAEVEASGKIDRHNDDSKIASARIHIKAQISLPDLISRAVKWVVDHVSKEATPQQLMTGDHSAATNTGNYSAATNTGYHSAATNTGYRSAATNTGDNSAATNTGNHSAATNTGDHSAATIEGEDKHAVAISSGYQGKAKASAGSAIVFCFRDENYKLIHIRAAIAGKAVKPDVFYMLNSAGEFVEAA